MIMRVSMPDINVAIYGHCFKAPHFKIYHCHINLLSVLTESFPQIEPKNNRKELVMFLVAPHSDVIVRIDIFK